MLVINSFDLTFTNNYVDIKISENAVLLQRNILSNVLYTTDLTSNYFSAIYTGIGNDISMFLFDRFGTSPRINITSINNTYKCTNFDTNILIGDYINFYTVNDTYINVVGTANPCISGIVGGTPDSSLVYYNNVTRIEAANIDIKNTILSATQLPPI